MYAAPPIHVTSMDSPDQDDNNGGLIVPKSSTFTERHSRVLGSNALTCTGDHSEILYTRLRRRVGQGNLIFSVINFEELSFNKFV